MNEQQNSPRLDCVAPSKPWTWKDNLRMKLFPTYACLLPDAPRTHKGHVQHFAEFESSFIERIRFLVTGKIRVETKVVSEFEMGQVVGMSMVTVLPPKWLQRK